jgi:hypothetical protein
MFSFLGFFFGFRPLRRKLFFCLLSPIIALYSGFPFSSVFPAFKFSVYRSCMYPINAAISCTALFDLLTIFNW